jgi:hypothetical protein
LYHEKNTQYHIITMFYIFIPSSMNRYSMGYCGFTSGRASYFVYGITFTGSTRLRHCTTSRKVARSISDGVIGIFYCGPGVDSASPKRLQCSSGYHAGYLYPSSRVQTRLKQSDFSGEKILSMPSFGGEVKSHVVDLRHVKGPYTYRGSRML